MLIRARKKEKPWSRNAKLWLTAGCLLFCAASGVVAQHYHLPELVASKFRREASDLPVQAAAWTRAPRLQVLQLDIKFQHFLTLEEKRKQALADEILLTSSEDFVPARLRNGRRDIPVKLRLKGDWTDHLRGDKWSFRIKVKDNDHLWGMRTFSLQHPSTRNWDAEWLYHKHLRREQVLALRYGFVDVHVNGDDRGVFALEEHFSKELLESQRRREGVIIKPDEDGMWRRRITQRKYHSLRYEDLDVMPLSAFQLEKVRHSLSQNSAFQTAALRCREVSQGALPASQAFDVKLLARHLAISELWGARHAMTFHNFRYYYNPLSAKLEPIGFDANPLMHEEPRLLATEGRWTARLLEDPIVADAYVRELERITQPAYLESLRQDWRHDWDSVVAVLKTEWPRFEANVWRRLEERAKMLRGLLERRTPIQGWFRRGGSLGEPRVQFGFANTDLLPLIAKQVLLSDDAEPVDCWKPVLMFPTDWPTATNDHSAVALPEKRRSCASLAIVCRMAGRDHDQTIELRPLDAVTEPAAQLGVAPAATAVEDTTAVEDILKRHAYLEYDSNDARTLRVKPGEWQVDHDLQVPPGWTLEVSAGTTLRFDSQAGLRGDGLRMRGTREAPIRLEPKQEQWLGVFLRGERPCLWRHVLVRQTSQGVFFRNPTVLLEACVFQDSRGDSALALEQSSFQLERCEFDHCRADAVRVEFGQGKLVECRFRAVGENALTLIRAEAQLDQAVMHGVGGCGVQVGLQSELEADHVLIRKANAGIDCWAHSRAALRGLYLENVQTGLQARRGGPAVGDSRIDVVRFGIRQVARPHRVELGSQIYIDEHPVAGQ